MATNQGVAPTSRDLAGWVSLLLEHAATGTVLNLAGDGAEPDPAQADAWPEDRRLPAEAVRQALLRLQRDPALADPRGLRVIGADIPGRLDLENLQVPCPLWLDRCRLRYGADLRGSHLPKLSLVGSHLAGQRPDTPALSALGATITGQLNLSGATLSNKDGDALNFDGASIGGDAFFVGVTATGEVRALGATITGQLNLGGATLSNKDGDALSLDRASIGGDAFLNQRFTSTGQVRAPGATITGQLNLSGATLSNKDRTALTLQGARVTQLWLRDVVKVDGELDLAACQIGDLVGDEQTPHPPPGQLFAGSWEIRSLQGQLATDARLAQTWLDTRPPQRQYTPQPARALADVYDRSGHPDQARKLRYTAARQVAKNAPRWARPWHTTYDALVGHGYYPLRTLVWLSAGLVLAGVLTTRQAAMFTPTDPAKAVAAASTAQGIPPEQVDQLTGATPCHDLGTYPCFVPWPYALQTVVPPASAVQTTAWQPTQWLLVAITALKASGWILVALLLAGVTGLLRRT